MNDSELAADHLSTKVERRKDTFRRANAKRYEKKKQARTEDQVRESNKHYATQQDDINVAQQHRRNGTRQRNAPLAA